MDPARHESLYADYVAELQRRYPRLKIIPKRDSRLCRAIDVVLKGITFGGQDRFLTSYTTTLGYRIYVPESWPAQAAGERYCTLRHEVVHVRQFRRLTWPLITLLYVFVPLPFGFAGGRAWLEWQGYRETIEATWQVYGRAAAHDDNLAREIVRRFTGPDYGWMWIARGTIERAIRRHLARLGAAPPPPLDVA